MLRSLWNRLATFFTPDELLLRPCIDFDPRSGYLKITVNSELNGKPICLSQRSLTRGRGAFQGRRFIINQHGLKVIQSVIASCEWTDDVTLCCKKDNVPGCLNTLRNWFSVGQTSAAKAVTIHTAPLENRTYLDLDDPETLIVRQTLTTPDESFVQPSPPAHEEHPSWLRVVDQFFKMPSKRLPNLTRGTEMAPGKRRLVKDELPEFIENDLPPLKKSGRVFLDKEVSELRVVPSPPHVQTSVDLDESKSEIIIHPRYKSGDESINHAELQRQSWEHPSESQNRTWTPAIPDRKKVSKIK
jgi:hypothetical protein